MNDTALLTGSQVYGFPTEASDVDVVVLMTPEDAYVLSTLFGDGRDPTKQNDPHYPVFQFKVGKLNLIVETEYGRFEVWRRGTELLQVEAPVTRDRAVEVFQKLRAAQRQPDCPF